MILDDPDKSLELVLSSSVTTNQLQYYVCYNRSSNTAINGRSTDGETNDTTAITIVPAPAVSVQHYLIFFSVYNADTVDADVIIQLNNNSSIRKLFEITLNSGDTLSHTESDWHVTDSDGKIKVKTDTGTPTDHGSLSGLSDDDHTQYLLADGTRSLSSNWDAGSYKIQAETFQSDVATGTAPLVISSTTLVSNLNVDLLDSQDGSYYLSRSNHTGTQTASTISDFDTEVSNNTNVSANTTHRTSSGTDHSYIDQDVTSGATPTFVGTNFSSIPASALPNADDDSTTKGVATFDNSDFNAALGVITINDSGIDHTAISNIGTNSHSQIDTHIASTSNPHSVSKSDVNLGNVTNDAQIKKTASVTNGNVPSWNGTTGDALADGYDVTTTLGDPGDDSTLATEAAIRTAIDGAGGLSDHGSLSGLVDDDHEQYALLAGRSGGQHLKGGTDASDDLTLESTDNVTKGEILLSDPARLVTNSIPGSPSAGTTYSDGSNVYYYNGSVWLNMTTPVSFNDSIYGLTVSNGTDSDHDIDISTGSATLTNGSGDYIVFFLTSSITKQIDANWTEGTDAGGFPSGLTLAADTHYNVFIIGKNDGTLDAGFDTSSSAANLLSDASSYSWYRRIGSRFTDSSSNLYAVIQTGNYNEYYGLVTDIEDASLTNATFETGTISIPPNQVALVFVIVIGLNCRSVVGNIRHPDAAQAISLTTNNALGYYDGATNETREITGNVITTVNDSSQIKYAGAVTGSGSESLDSIKVFARAWWDDRL